LQVGVDCEEISRFRRLSYGENEKFYGRIFTPGEIKYCNSFRDPYPRFTVRFAAKEAAIKAFNSTAKIFYTDIEVQKEGSEQPRLYFDKKKFKKISRLNISLSLTHSRSHAIAFIVITDGKYNPEKMGRILKKRIGDIKRQID